MDGFVIIIDYRHVALLVRSDVHAILQVLAARRYGALESLKKIARNT